MGIISEYLCCSDESVTIDTRALPEYHGHGGGPFNGHDRAELLDEALPIQRFGCNTWGKIMHYCDSSALQWWDAISTRVSAPVTLYFLCEDSDKRYFQIHLDPVAKRASWRAANEDDVPKKLLRAPRSRGHKLTHPKRLRKIKNERRARETVKLGALAVDSRWDKERWNGKPDVDPSRFRRALGKIESKFRPCCENRSSMW